MKTLAFVLIIGALFVACSRSANAPTSATSPHIGRRCTSNVHCPSDEVCWTYSVGTPGRDIRDGFCGKL